MSPAIALRMNWPEYLIEAWALGMFMISAGMFGTLLGSPQSPALGLVADPVSRRVLGGLAMGLTAIAIIYSPWGRRSGAHMNPAVTLTFWRLRKVRGWDALFYTLSQFAGGALGVLLVLFLLGPAFADPPVRYVATLPGTAGVAAAFAAEFAISLGMMLMILCATNAPRLAPYTGLFAGGLVALYISLEDPLSGMSMNPARSFASAAPAENWEHLWIYFSAPLLGMLSAAELYLRATTGASRIGCAKLQHAPEVRCIHCGYEPPPRVERQAHGNAT